jgi:hypothetical protein
MSNISRTKDCWRGKMRHLSRGLVAKNPVNEIVNDGRDEMPEKASIGKPGGNKELKK